MRLKESPQKACASVLGTQQVFWVFVACVIHNSIIGGEDMTLLVTGETEAEVGERCYHGPCRGSQELPG